MAEKILLALSTFPDAEIARRISNQLVSERFTACANILPSVNRFTAGKIKLSRETKRSSYSSQRRSAIGLPGQTAIASSLRGSRIIFVSIASGLTDYLQWVSENCG